ncbi:MAG: YqiA/YcfP family alpha/beta fold hydrolase [Rhodospirillaceae bacterium]
MKRVIVYLHGFNSSPQSHKARLLERYMAERGLADRYVCPALPPRASAALARIEPLLAPGTCLVGSSLGGFYATWLAEKHDLRAVLINPAIDPHLGLRGYLGPQQNLYTGERYQLTEAHLGEWHSIYAPRVSPGRYLLLVETGDEVLDYRKALARYSGCEQVVVQGGDHTLQSFAQHLPRIVRFAGLDG